MTASTKVLLALAIYETAGMALSLMWIGGWVWKGGRSC